MKRTVPAFFLLLLLMESSCTHHSASRSSTKNETKDKALKIAVISDLNSSYGSVTYNNEVTAVIKDLARLKPDIIVCAGDMVAGQKASLTEQNIRDMWKGFKNTVLTPVNQLNIPFGFTLGNHDASPSYLTDRSLAKQFWNENKQATNLQFIDTTHYPFYFSYIQNNVFFMSWDAAGSRVPAEVYDWMHSQLNNKTARAARLRILVGHLPLYPIVNAKNKPGEVNASADSALTFFRNNGIDLYISGHQHAWYPAKKNGLRLLNAGCIGDGERPIMGHDGIGRKAYTIIDVPANPAQKFTYSTYMPVSNQLIDPTTLPHSVVGFNGVVERDDL